MAADLNKILKLAKRTGDNVIVFDQSNPADSYVILALKNYERLVGEIDDFDFLTEEERADKINGDIDFWNEDEEADFLPPHLRDNWEDDDEFSDAPTSPRLRGTSEAMEDDKLFDPEALEDEWEEEVNYLYPTEDELALMHQAPLKPETAQETPETLAEAEKLAGEDLAEKGVFATEPQDEDLDEATSESGPTPVMNHFNSVSEILSERSRSWEIPEERQR